ncbi:hypothetical protein M9H77_26864 [Catharanthus roseus]|uniref:Uncharacterized protein n=1 Tax=Catharanthus roseus TaxID=4058 RepID=A0ACC0ABV9_CATRO|nr:hypothetical protein M9H77_26864 [Catharanthus roseus]
MKKKRMHGHNMVEEVFYLSAQRGYKVFYRSCDENNILSNIFGAYLTSIQMMRTWPHILIIDTTYKTNKYNMPLLEARHQLDLRTRSASSDTKELHVPYKMDIFIIVVTTKRALRSLVLYSIYIKYYFMLPIGECKDEDTRAGVVKVQFKSFLNHQEYLMMLGATCSFVSLHFIKHIPAPSVVICYQLKVGTPIDVRKIAEVKYLDCDIYVENVTIFGDLIALLFEGYDMTLGMDGCLNITLK